MHALRFKYLTPEGENDLTILYTFTQLFAKRAGYGKRASISLFLLG